MEQGEKQWLLKIQGEVLSTVLVLAKNNSSTQTFFWKIICCKSKIYLLCLDNRKLQNDREYITFKWH